jgi:phenylpyruvate tautomerase PptA (4-oxalocrotonate tautomerase family)
MCRLPTAFNSYISLNVTSSFMTPLTKQALYRRVAELLVEDPGLRSEDVQVILSSNDRDEWSFGKGLASYVKEADST